MEIQSCTQVCLVGNNCKVSTNSDYSRESVCFMTMFRLSFQQSVHVSPQYQSFSGTITKNQGPRFNDRPGTKNRGPRIKDPGPRTKEPGIKVKYDYFLHVLPQNISSLRHNLSRQTTFIFCICCMIFRFSRHFVFVFNLLWLTRWGVFSFGCTEVVWPWTLRSDAKNHSSLRSVWLLW